MPENFLDLITLEMGNSKSKHKGLYGRTKKNPSGHSAGSRDAKRSSDGNRERSFLAEINERFAEDEELKMLRHTIHHNPELFILNNLMMSVQFFENFDEEIASIRQALVSSREAELNACLPTTKRALIPDVLQQHVARRVRFSYVNPTRNLTIELLHPIRIYVVFDNIEVTERSDVSHYSEVSETVTYSLQLKPSPNNKDCVFLQRLNESPTKKTNPDDLDSVSSSTKDYIYSDGDSVYGGKSSASFAKSNREIHDDESIFEEDRYASQDVFDYPTTSRMKDESLYGTSKTSDRPGTSARPPNKLYGRARHLRSANGSLAGSSSSGYRSGVNMDSDSDCSYPRTTHATPKTSKSSLDSDFVTSRSELPPRCFKKVIYSHDGTTYNQRRGKKQRMNYTDRLIRKTLKSQNYTVHYLSASRFMKHFCHLFAEELACPMGFDARIEGDGTAGVVYRTKVRRLENNANTRVEQFEILPSVRAEWPECAQEWLDRPRATWPSYAALEDVKGNGCHLVPQLNVPEITGSHRGLDWQLVFPRAERYLETYLTYPQVRVYLTALMLQKNFMRPIDSSFGLTVSHIKNKLFWLVEKDDRPSMWMEHRTGESLVNLLESLHSDVQQESPRLPDYFLPDKNLLEGSKNLLSTQKQLSRIIGNPVMYVLHAMEKIVYSPGFFPRPDFGELFRILKDDTILLANPALAAHVSRPIGRPNRAPGNYEQTTGIWEKSKREDGKEAIYSRKPVDMRSLINPRRDVNQVTDISVKIESMEPRRMSFLLDFFVRHFIKMAESCNNFRALPQKVAYVDQAERLSFLLSEHQTHREVAKVYLEKLYALKRRAARSRSQTTAAKTPPSPPPPDPPETPRRNAAICVRPLTQRHQIRTEDGPADRRAFSKLPTSSETEYEQTGATSNVYRLQAPPGPRKGRQVVEVTIHEENSEVVEIRKAQCTAGGGAGSSSDKTRVISIAETQDESFMTETTYV